MICNADAANIGLISGLGQIKHKEEQQSVFYERKTWFGAKLAKYMVATHRRAISKTLNLVLATPL